MLASFASFFFLFFLIVGGYLLVIFNGIVRLREQVDRAWSNVDVVLRQRLDEIPNLVECVKGYALHEQETIKNVAAARSQYLAQADVTVANTAHATASLGINRLFALVEAYPELRADERFAALQTRISALEDQLADRREFYNHTVATYNMRLGMLPDKLLARLLALKERVYFNTGEAGALK